MTEKTIGSRAEVMHGTARRTSGGLTKDELMYNKQGRIVSREKHKTAKKEQRLLRHGYGSKKGHFGFVRTKRSSRRHRKHRGGGDDSDSDSDMDMDVDTSSAFPSLGSEETITTTETTYGGRRRHHRKGGSGLVHGMHGGDVYGSKLSPSELEGSGIAGQGITNYSAEGSLGPQIAAGMAGGRRRSHRRRSTHRRSSHRGSKKMGGRSRSRSHRRRRHRGGTTKPSLMNPGMGSIGVQLRAGLGN